MFGFLWIVSDTLGTSAAKGSVSTFQDATLLSCSIVQDLCVCNQQRFGTQHEVPVGLVLAFLAVLAARYIGHLMLCHSETLCGC